MTTRISQSTRQKHTITSPAYHSGGIWRVVYTNGAGNVIELPLGASDTYLKSNGTTSAPSFGSVSGDKNLDGGFANATYLPSQSADGGGA